MALKRSIIVQGDPRVNEDGVASAIVKPGYLVDGVTSIAAHASAAAANPAAYALERDELGKGIDTTYGSETSDYAVGDTVKVGVFKPGDRVLAFCASGQNITANDRLESAGDGTLRKYNAGVILARALETTGAVTTLTRLVVEVM